MDDLEPAQGAGDHWFLCGFVQACAKLNGNAPVKFKAECFTGFGFLAASVTELGGAISGISATR